MERRTDQQNRALHLWFEQLAKVLNDEGKSMSVILQKFVLDIPASKYSVKELLWKPLQSAMYGKESTTELLKKEEIDKVYDALCKFMGEEIQVQVPPFPSVEENIFNETYGNKTLGSQN